jgi:hypothetical protein
MRRDDAPIATPCGADWTAMSPRGKARLCGQCDKLVHDLSAMTERDARALLKTRPTEGLCVRYLHDATGEIWFGARAERVVPASRLVGRGAAMMSAAALVLVPALTEACGGAAPDKGPYNYPTEADDGGTAVSTGSDRRTTAQPTVGAGAEAVRDAGSTGPDSATDALANVVPSGGGDAGPLPGDASAD